METLRPNAQRSKNAIIFVWACCAMDLISLISDFFEYRLLGYVSDGNEITSDAATSNDMRQMIIGLISLVFSLISGVTFIMWFRRAYYNLSLKLSMELSDGWAAGAWFVPVLGWFRPYQMMRELYLKTYGFLLTLRPDGSATKSFGFLGVWWALWLITNFIGNIILKITFKSETLDELMGLSIAQMSLSVFGILLAPVTVKVIKDYSIMENELYNAETSVINTVTA